MKLHHLLIILVGLVVGGCALPQSAPSHTNTLPPLLDAKPVNDVLIISATYGSGVKFADVTYRVNNLLRQPEVEFFARPEWLAADPTPGWNKALVIVYEFKGRRRVFATGEGGKVSVAILLDSGKKS